MNPRAETNEVRDRIAELIYGDGHELAWNRSLQIADIIIWELGLVRQESYESWDTLEIDKYRFVTEWLSIYGAPGRQ